MSLLSFKHKTYKLWMNRTYLGLILSKYVSLYFMYFDNELFQKFKKQMLFVLTGQIGGTIVCINLWSEIVKGVPSVLKVFANLLLLLLIFKSGRAISNLNIILRFIVIPCAFYFLSLLN
jgi:hypothetical protein